MRVTFARRVVAMGVGLAAMAVAMTVQGCRKQAAPAAVQPVVRRVPRVQPDFPVGSLPVEHINPGVMPRRDQGARRRQPVPPSDAEGTDRQAAVAQAAIAAAERQQDARLLQQQQAASDAQQKELNQEIEQRTKAQQAVQAEPRIQDTIPGPAPAPVAPAQPTQPQ
jgi:hypothetical protein